MSTPKITNKTISLSRYNNLKVNAAEKQKAMDAVYPFWQMLTKEDQNDILNSCKKFKEKRSGLFGWLNHEKQNNILECLETSINDKLKTLGKENKNLAKSITENLYILMKNEIWIFKSKIPTSLQSLSSNSKLDEKMNYFGVKSFTNNRRCEDDIINSKLEDKDFKYIINNLHRFNDRQRNIIVDRLNRNPNLLDPMCDGIISILVVLMSDSKTSGTNLSVEPIVIKALAQDKFNNHPYALENVVNLLEVFKGNNNAQNTIVNMISNVEFARQHPQALEKMVDKLEMFEDNKVAQNTIVDIISDVEFALQHPQALEKVVDKLEIFKNNKVAQNKIVNIISNVEFALQHPQALEKVVDKLEIFKGNNNARNTIVDIISDVE
ncbi:MAG: hypothetical protein QG673_1709, partial [Pseudomonadota bacterium]|nr:hypothetical protein [Pseudomonadota bacterium]